MNPDRGSDRHPEAREATLGRPQDPRTAGPTAGRRPARPGQEHDPRRSTPARPGQGDRPSSPSRLGHRAVDGSGSQRAVVRRLQRRVQTRQRAKFWLAERVGFEPTVR